MNRRVKMERIGLVKLAGEMGIRPSTLGNLIESGDLPFGQVIRQGHIRTYLIYRDRVDAWLRGIDFKGVANG